MTKIKFPLITASLILLSSIGFSQSINIYEEARYTSLYNGKDLSGWKVPEANKGNRSVIDGVIDCDSRMEDKGDKHLWTPCKNRQITRGLKSDTISKYMDKGALRIM